MMLSTCACTDTSSADVGSSQTRNSGCVASARAIEMRWRWPPENWCGNFSTSAPARPTDCSSSDTRAFKASSRTFDESPPLPATSPCSRSGSPTMSSTFQRGFRLAYGSWKIICMRRRSVCASADLNVAAVSTPSKRTRPRVGAYRPTSSRATVLLPQPDSPTSASVLPRSMAKLTPSTACTNWRGLRSTTRLSHGADTSKVFARSCTSTSGFVATVLSAVAFMRPPSRCRRRAASRRHASRPASSSSGRSTRQRSKTCGQRGLKAQPVGMALSRGIAPSICSRRSRSSSIAGIEPIRPTV